MRRLFVICLILLYPLNVLALSTSVASLQTGATEHVLTQYSSQSSTQSPLAPDAADLLLADAFDCKLTCDLDPDEPPSGTDFHDTVNEVDEPRVDGVPLRTLATFVASRHLLSAFPPLKPPPLA